MRRHPVKTINFLNDNNTTGIVHFAGTDGGLEVLCRWPFHYPAYRSAAMPLFLSVYSSLDRTCHFKETFRAFISTRITLRGDMQVWKSGEEEEEHLHKLPELALCDYRAVTLLKEELARAEMQVMYSPGTAGKEFSWPPPA